MAHGVNRSGRVLRWIVSAMVCAGAAGAASASEIVPIDPSDRVLLNDALHVNHLQLQRLALPDAPEDHMVVNVRLDGRIVLLDLTRRAVTTPDAMILLDMGNGEMVSMPLPETRTYRGVARGLDDAIVAATLTDDGLRAFIRTDEGLVYNVQPLGDLRHDRPEHLDPTLHSVHSDLDSRDIAEFCGGALVPEGEEASCCPSHGAGTSGTTRGTTCLRVIDLVIDVDHLMFNAFSGNTTNITNDVTTIINNTNVIFERDVDARLDITDIVIRTTASAPYSNTTSAGSLLNQMSNVWGGQSTANRDLVHLFTTRDMGGVLGVAWLGGLCNPSLGTALSDFGAYSSFSNKTKITAHEIGHNCGSPHDNEPGSSCQSTGSGFLMNPFIQTGGNPNFSTFSACSISRITPTLNGANCTTPVTEIPAVAVNDAANTLTDNVASIDVLANDVDPCGVPGVQLVSASSSQGGSVALGAVSLGRQRVDYTPPSGFAGVDTFQYRAVNGGGLSNIATVTVTVVAGRVPENPADAIPGVRVEYFALAPTPMQLPDFDALAPSGDAVFSFINLISTSGAILSSGQSDNLGMRISGFVTVPETAFYTFELESDDGSRLFIGDTLVVDNSAVSGSQLNSGEIALAPGAHQVTILYYEGTGSARLQPRLSGSTFSGGVIPASAWSYVPPVVEPTPCPCDRNGDTFQTVADFFAFLNDFNAQLNLASPQPGSADFDASGSVTPADFFAFLNGCLGPVSIPANPCP